MKLLLKAIPYIIIAILMAAACFQQLHISSLKKHRNEQSEVIEAQNAQISELMKLKTYNFEVKINVTDKSKLKVNNKGNKGTVNTSGDKSYSIDSISFSRIIENIIQSETKK